MAGVSDEFVKAPENLNRELNYGSTLLYTGRYVEAYSVAFSVLTKANASGKFALKAEALLLLANIAIRTGELQLASTRLTQVRDIFSKMQNGTTKSILQFRYLLGMSALEISKSDYAKAYDYIKEAERISVEPDSMPFTLNMNIAIIYDFMKNDEGAEQYYKKIIESPKSHYNKYIAINNYADFLLRRDRPLEAIQLLDENTSVFEAMGAKHALAQTYILLFNAYDSLGDYKAATEAAATAIDINREITTDHFNMQQDQIACIYENSILKEASMRNFRALKTLLIFSLVFQLILGFIFCLTIVRVKKRHRNKAHFISELKELKLHYIANGARLANYEEAINRKNRELVACKMELNQYKQAVDDLSKMEKTEAQEQKPLSQIVEKIKALNHSKSNWDTMKIYFEEIYPGFYKKLEQKHPDLTRGEKRMSAFIISGMNTAEIAYLCNRSQRTIHSVKYQMKKKLGLTQQESLEQYLNAFK